MRDGPLVLVMGFLVSAAAATDYTWSGATGSFQDASKWAPVGVPGAADKALFTSAGTYGVGFDGDAANASAVVGADVTFALNGSSWLLSGALSFSGASAARFGGGALTVGANVAVGARQKLVLESGAGRFLGHVDTPAAGGSVEVNGGEHIVVGRMQLYPPADGGPALRVTGGMLSLTNAVDPARFILQGARVSLEGGTLSVRYQTDMYGAPNAPGVIDVYTNATLLHAPAVGFNMARSPGGLSILNIRGGAVIISNSNFSVVHTQYNPSPTTATGLVNLVDGLLYAHNARFSYWSNTVAVLHQTGGRLHVPNEFSLGYHTNSLGVYKLEGGAAWCSQLYAGGFGCGTGEVQMSGGQLAVTGSSSALGKFAGSCGRLLQSGGELIISNSFSVGAGAGAVGVVTNTGGSLWVRDSLYIGNSSAGSFGQAYFCGLSNAVQGGVTVGNSAGSTGVLVVADGELLVGGNMAAGYAAGSSGAVAVSGGTLSAKNGTLTLGNTAGAEGSLCVTGGTGVFKGLTVGSAGRGVLTVSGGLLAVTNGSPVVVANLAGSVGVVEISGGTNLFLGQGVTFGQNGSGLVRFSGGTTFTTNRVVVGGAGSGTGRVEFVGGVFSAPICAGRDPSLATNPGGYSEVLFDGGTLRHSVDNEAWMPGAFVSWFAKATLTGRGAVIDSNGGAITIPQAMSNEVGHAGSFAKKGAGKLTLSSLNNAFTGRVSVEEGELAVAGLICLAGGVAVDSGAILNLADAGAVRDLVTAPGTVSRIDGALTLKPGTVLTNGVGASLGGSGVVTGSLVFASGSVCARSKTEMGHALRLTGGAVFQDGVTVSLTGYTAQDLAAGIPLVTAVSPGTLQLSATLPVTLDGLAHPSWWARLSSDGLTLTARVIPKGTLIAVK